MKVFEDFYWKKEKKHAFKPRVPILLLHVSLELRRGVAIRRGVLLRHSEHLG